MGKTPGTREHGNLGSRKPSFMARDGKLLHARIKTHIESFISIFFHSYNISFERNSKKIITKSGSFF